MWHVRALCRGCIFISGVAARVLALASSMMRLQAATSTQYNTRCAMQRAAAYVSGSAGKMTSLGQEANLKDVA